MVSLPDFDKLAAHLGNARLLVFYFFSMLFLLLGILSTDDHVTLLILWSAIILLALYVGIIVMLKLEGDAASYSVTGQDLRLPSGTVQGALALAAGQGRGVFAQQAPHPEPTKVMEGFADTSAYRFMEAQRLMCRQVARVLSVDSSTVRSTLFVVDGDQVHLFPGFCFNMHRSQEYVVEPFKPKEGSVGQAMFHKRINIAVKAKGWGDSAHAKSKNPAIHPRLTWIISWPMRVRAGNKYIDLVLNIDGLENRRNRAQVRRAVDGLVYWMPILTVILQNGVENDG